MVHDPGRRPDGLFFPGYGLDDANPDLGDSAITETLGIGGFAMAAAPAIVRFVGGSAADALGYTRVMGRITLARDPSFRCRRRVRRHADRHRCAAGGRFGDRAGHQLRHRPRGAGVGQIGAGIARAPLACFAQGLAALAERLGVEA